MVNNQANKVRFFEKIFWIANFSLKIVFGIPLNVRAQKIGGITLDTYKMVDVAFLIMDQANYIRFIEEIFLMTNISPKVVFGISFFILSGADINFLE